MHGQLTSVAHGDQPGGSLAAIWTSAPGGWGGLQLRRSRSQAPPPSVSGLVDDGEESSWDRSRELVGVHFRGRVSPFQWPGAISGQYQPQGNDLPL